MASANSTCAANRTIDLRKGHPKPSNLPNARIMMAMAMASKRLEANQLSLQYPPSYYGMPHFLKNLREFLHSAYNHNVFEDGLFTTNGVSHGLELCCATFTKPGDVVWIETPSYFLAHQVFLDHHLEVKGMPIDAQGLDTDRLAILLNVAKSLGNLPRMLYIVPSHGNPSGTVLPMERRVALLALARQYNFLVITDDVYHMLDWSDKLPRLLAFDAAFQRRQPAPDEAEEKENGGGGDAEEEEEDDAYTNFDRGAGADILANPDAGNVISLGSFTKILSPALRLGWLEASPALLAKVAARGYVVSGGTVAPFVSEIVNELIKPGGGLIEHLQTLNADYKKGAAALCEALQKHPDCFELLSQPRGGFFAWVELPEGISAQALLPVAEKHGVVFLPGPVCAPHAPPEACERHIRLCFAYEEADAIAEGVERLAAAVAEMRGGAGVEERAAKSRKVE